MTKSYQDEQDFVYAGTLNCKCSYVLGDKGFTALSNIVDTSPLFYADADYSDDVLFEEEFLELEELRAELLEGEAQELVKDQHKRAYKANKHLAGYTKAPIEKTFFENKTDILSSKPKSSEYTCQDIVALMNKTSVGTTLHSFAAEHGITFKNSNHVSNVFYDRDNKTILINTKISKTYALLGAVKALRQVFLHKNGLLIHPLNFHPDDAILLNRLMSADLQVIQCRFAWELKLQGETKPWEDLMSSVCHDLAASFAREAISDFRSLTNGKASLACLENWFLSGRCKATDKVLIQSMLADHNGLVFDHPETSKTASYEIIASLGEMPNGKNYLSTIIHQISEDPLYTEVRDRSNANFLWFIKFERSFRESEQNLQPSVNPSDEATSASSSKQDRIDGTQSNDVIIFKQIISAEENNGSDTNEDKKAPKKQVATIFYLEHFQNITHKQTS